MTVAVLVPVLGRPHRVRPLLDSLASSLPEPGSRPPVLTFFLCSRGDTEQIQAVRDLHETPHVMAWEPGPADYAKKINLGFELATGLRGVEWAFLGADDLRFHPGWLDACLRAHEATGACVIGTNDLGNAAVKAGRHATHSLVHRDYLECGTIDEPGKVLHEGYGHQWCDTELVGTAKSRGTWAFAHDAVVEHEHPFWGKGELDATYEKGLASAAADQRLFQRRRRLWQAAA